MLHEITSNSVVYIQYNLNN